jgi:tetratricopeptide (TPR) repeat protein
MTKAKRLSIQFEEAATKANDWQSIRRLHQILDDSVDITPLGTVIKNTRAPSVVSYAEPSNVATDMDVKPPKETKPLESENKEPTPLGLWMDNLTERMHNAGKLAEKDSQSKVDVTTFRQELLARPVRDFVHPEDIGRAMYLMNFLITPDCDRAFVWKWANTLVSSNQEVAYLISLLGRLGMTISMLDRLTAELKFDSQSPVFNDVDELDDLDDFDDEPVKENDLPPTSISNERLEQLIRKSLQMEATGVNNNFRAAEVFEYIGNAGEAERCYARAFKLDRTRDDAALALSRIYSETDRLQDALYVLDLCIREGGDSGELLFEAALKAHALTQHELQVSFLQKLHERHSPGPWTNYYLSSGLLELKRPQEAIEAIDQEVLLFQSNGLHIDSVRAAAYAQLGQSNEASNFIRLALSRPLAKINDLTLSGVSGAFERLITAAKMCPDERALQLEVEHKMLVAGIATERYCEHMRADEKPCDLYLYPCYVSQPLETSWPSSDGCLPDQTEWMTYIAQWGVLARNVAEAENLALEWQTKCYPLESTLVDIDSSDETLHDRPGIAFQGPRFAENEALNDDEDDEDDMDDDDESY